MKFVSVLRKKCLHAEENPLRGPSLNLKFQEEQVRWRHLPLSLSFQGVVGRLRACHFPLSPEHAMSVAVQFSTIYELFENITKRYADAERPMLMQRVEGIYKGISYRECRRNVELFALGLVSLGVKK